MNSTGTQQSNELRRRAKTVEDGSDADDGTSSTDPIGNLNTVPFEEDLYGAGIVALVLDAHDVMHGTGHTCVRMVRLLLSQALIFAMIGLQVFLIGEMANLVTARSVYRIRELYDAYELHMYGNETGHTFITVNGKHRGYAEYFQPDNIKTFSDKDEICGFPLSQPRLLCAVLLIWTLTVANNIRAAWDTFDHLVLSLPSLPSMSGALEYGDDETVVVGLSLGPKLFLTMFILLPRVVINLTLLWLGCRWLVATPSFADLILNAVALEFILMLKELLYFVAVSRTHKFEVTRTVVQVPHNTSEHLTLMTHLPSLFNVVVCILWVWVYSFYLQRVLPQYNWDVHDRCSEYLAEHEAY